MVINKILSKDANERLARVKLIKPQLAAAIENYLTQLYREGKIKSLISDEELKFILLSMNSKREYRIIK